MFHPESQGGVSHGWVSYDKTIHVADLPMRVYGLVRSRQFRVSQLLIIHSKQYENGSDKSGLAGFAAAKLYVQRQTVWRWSQLQCPCHGHLKHPSMQPTLQYYHDLHGKYNRHHQFV